MDVPESLVRLRCFSGATREKTSKEEENMDRSDYWGLVIPILVIIMLTITVLRFI